MTDDPTDETIDDPTESLTDVADALESSGAVPSEADETDEADGSEESSGGLPGPLGALETLTGTGKSLDSYKNNPIAEALGPEDSKGSLHIARGVDGLSPLGAANPLIDIGIGVVLLQMERKDEAEAESNGGETEVESAGAADDPTVSRVSEDLA